MAGSSARLEVNGAALDFREEGDGDPVVFVHGSASDRRTWELQLDPFSRMYRTIAYSRRYHWPNAKIREGADYSMPEHVDDLEGVLSALVPEPVHLVGHSYGAFLGLILALRAPDRIRSLVLAEPPAITLFTSRVPRPPELLRLLLRRPRTAAAIMKFGMLGAGPAAAAARRGDLDGAVRAFGKAVLGSGFYNRLSSERLNQVRTNSFKAEFLGSGFSDLEDGEIRGMRKPVLLIQGEKSPAVFHRVLDRLQELLPGARRIVIPGSSHIMHEDNPEAYNTAVLSFLAAN